ncbi:MAG: ABC transporter [Proteobacteria bacterium]|nr:ABC transporter [Pseudomonadota bacterium]
MNYQLVIQFPITDASADDFDRLIMIETELGIVLRDQHDVDGHHLGAGEMNIFIHTDNPREAFRLARDVLSKADLETIVVAFREMTGEDYSVIWPENFDSEFGVK